MNRRLCARIEAIRIQPSSQRKSPSETGAEAETETETETEAEAVSEAAAVAVAPAPAPAPAVTFASNLRPNPVRPGQPDRGALITRRGD